jgi:hypothetical protein
MLHVWCALTIQPNLESKTRPKQLLGSLPLDIALPGALRVLLDTIISKFKIRTVRRRLGVRRRRRCRRLGRFRRQFLLDELFAMMKLTEAVIALVPAKLVMI